METQKIKKQQIVKENNKAILNSFSNNNLQDIEEEGTIVRDEIYWANKKQLDLTLKRIDSGESKMHTLEELDEYIEKIISKYEN